jgi:hypothetical protein
MIETAIVDNKNKTPNAIMLGIVSLIILIQAPQNIFKIVDNSKD